MRILSRRALTISLMIGLVIGLVGVPARQAQAEPMREFVLSSTYGVMAGTLVGAASLAFSDRPGDNLNRVARGASIGLYAGILLGLYVVYGVSSGAGDESDQLGEIQPPRFLLYPVATHRGEFDGAAAQFRVLTF